MTTEIETRERPILFSAPMVRATLAGHKTMTRRVVTSRARRDGAKLLPELLQQIGVGHACPYGSVGDRLWVRETWAPMQAHRPIANPERYDDKPAWYRADNDRPMWAGNVWKPSIFMPRNCSRINLEITAVRVERVQEIDELDALAEGAIGRLVEGVIKEAGKPPRRGKFIDGSSRDAFRELWDKLNGPRGFGWDVNPWVWCVSFRRIKP